MLLLLKNNKELLFSSYPKAARQLLNGCWLIPPSKCRRKKAQIFDWLHKLDIKCVAHIMANEE